MNEITVLPLEQWMLDTIRFDDPEKDVEIKHHLAEIVNSYPLTLRSIYGEMQVNMG